MYFNDITGCLFVSICRNCHSSAFRWTMFCTYINALRFPFKASVAFYGNLISTITREYSISLNAPLKSSWQIKRIFLSTVKNKCSIDN